MSKQCNEKDLYYNLSKIAKFIERLKQNICTVERQYYQYPNIQYVKKFNKFLNMAKDKKLENSWGFPIAQINYDLFESNFYKKYDNFVKKSKLTGHFTFHTFITNFIDCCFYDIIDNRTIKKIANGFFRIINGSDPLITIKIFSNGLISKETYHINNFLTITKPRIEDFDIKKIKDEQVFDYDEVVSDSKTVIYYKSRQHSIGDNYINIQDRLKFIFVLFTLVKFQSFGGYNLTFDFYSSDFSDSYFFHRSINAYLRTEFQKKNIDKFKKTYNFLIKNFTRYDFNIHNYTGRLGIALKTYHDALDQLGSIAETTPYAVKIINSLLIPERDNSKNRFVNRIFVFLYYLGIRNNKTKEILDIAYNWRSNYFHGAPTKEKKLKNKNNSLTEKYVELFMLNCARQLIFTLIILKQKNGEKLTKLIDNTYTIHGIKKLESELSVVKKYMPIYKKGIKIKEDGLYIDILEC